MADSKFAEPKFTSATLAADVSLIPVWDPTVSFPSPQEMPDPAIVTHVCIERSQPAGWHYLLEANIAWHNGRFYLGWANNVKMENNNREECIRGRTSLDGLRWSEPSIWVDAPAYGAESFNNAITFEHSGKLYGFFVAWRNGYYPTTEVFIFDDISGEWKRQESTGIPNFVPYCTPQRTADGNWVIGGEHRWYEAAVAISHGDDLLKWDIVDIPRPQSLRLFYPETAIVARGNDLLAVCRPDVGTPTAPVSESHDGGRTWTPLGLSNFPLSNSQPFSGQLSTGQHYLLTNSLEEGRGLLSIALTGPEGGLFKRIYKVRHQQWPARRYMFFFGQSWVGLPTEWSYTKAIEHDGKLYIAYSQGKEDCVLSIIPVDVLAL